MNEMSGVREIKGKMFRIAHASPNAFTIPVDTTCAIGSRDDAARATFGNRTRRLSAWLPYGRAITPSQIVPSATATSAHDLAGFLTHGMSYFRLRADLGVR